MLKVLLKMRFMVLENAHNSLYIALFHQRALVALYSLVTLAIADGNLKPQVTNVFVYILTGKNGQKPSKQ